MYMIDTNTSLHIIYKAKSAQAVIWSNDYPVSQSALSSPIWQIRKLDWCLTQTHPAVRWQSWSLNQAFGS